MRHGLRLALVAGLSDKKLAQKVGPLAAMEEVEGIDLYRRRPFEGRKIRWVAVPKAPARSPSLHEVWRLARLLTRAGRFDALIGCHQRFHGLAAALAGRARRRPVIQLVTTGVDWVWRRPPLRFALKSAAAIGVRGPRSLERLRALGFMGPVEVIPNPFVPPPASPEPLRRFDLLAVGDCTREKDYPWMLEVLARVRRHRPETTLAIAGAGRWRERLGSTIGRLGLSGAVSFLGTLDDRELQREFSASRALLLTSSVEGLPMAVLEAMAAGLPALVTAVGELPGLVADGREGRVVQHGDTEGMARAVIETISDPSVLARMGRAARDRVVGLSPGFSVEAIQRAWRSLLSELLPPTRGLRYPTAP